MSFIEIAHAQEAEMHTEEAADGGVLSSLGISGPLFTAQLINFAIIAVILWFLILKPLSSKLRERAKMIDDSIENAKRVEENMHRSEKEFQARIDAAKVEAGKIVEKAASQADGVANDIKAKAKVEIDLLVAQAKKNIAIEKEETIQGIREEAAVMIVTALEKILSEKMSDEKDKKMIEEMVKKLK